jgi:eukaryotic-like serine/threonine-protein kinase
VIATARVRVAIWLGDDAAIEESLTDLDLRLEEGTILSAMAAACRGRKSARDIGAAVLGMRRRSPRLVALSLQFAAEAALHQKEPEVALSYIEQAAEGAFVDVEWLDKCPPLRAFHGSPRFTEIRRAVQRRVDEIWAD